MAKAAASKKPENLAEEYKQGSVKVRVFDDYIVKNAEEKAKLDERITRICWEIVTAARTAGKDI